MRWVTTCSPQTSAAGVRLRSSRESDRVSGTYTAILDCDGELIVAVADMAAPADLDPEHVNQAPGDRYNRTARPRPEPSSGTLEYALDLTAAAEVRRSSSRLA